MYLTFLARVDIIKMWKPGRLPQPYTCQPICESLITNQWAVWLQQTAHFLPFRSQSMIWQISQIGRENRLRREEKSERKPSGCPFTFNNPPQRKIAKLVNSKINNFAILQTAWRKARQGFLTSCYMYHLLRKNFLRGLYMSASIPPSRDDRQPSLNRTPSIWN